MGHKSPTECDSMDAEYVKLYSRYNAYIECADPAVHADHDVFSSKDRLFAEIQAIHSRWSLSCPRNKTPPAGWVAVTPDLMAPPDHVMHLSDDDMMYSLATMDDSNFDHILSVCDNASTGYDPPDNARAHCDALLALAPDDFDSLLMARDFKMAGTTAASQQNHSNQLAINNGTFARGPSTSGFGRTCLVVAVVVVLHVVVLSDVDRVPRPKVAMLRWVRTSQPTDRHRTTETMLITTLLRLR